jgi:hypothetical protein
MSRIRYDQAKGKGRGQGFFPQLSTLAVALIALSEPITDRGLTGPAVRDPDDVRSRLSAREAKLARRAAAAKKAGLL